LGFCDTPEIKTLYTEEYKAELLATKPDKIKNDDYVNNLYKQIYADPNPRKSLTMLHLSDIHLDIEYKVGSLGICDSYICCREEFGMPTE